MWQSYPKEHECRPSIECRRFFAPDLWEGPIGAMRPMSEFDPSQRCWVHEQLNKKTVAGPARRAADASRFSDDVRVDPTTCVQLWTFHAGGRRLQQPSLSSIVKTGSCAAFARVRV
jgi:hypothetical protein